MILIYINLVIAAITFVLFILSTIEATQKFKLKYPDIKVPKSTSAEKIGAFVRMVLSSLIPIVNICFLWTLIFHDSDIVDRSIRKMYDECMEEVSE